MSRFIKRIWNHVKNRRAAQLAVLLAALAVAGTAVLLTQPAFAGFQALVLTLAGLFVFGLGLAYLGYRSFNIAVHLAAQTQALQRRLDTANGEIDDLRRELTDGVAREARVLGSRLPGVDQRLGALQLIVEDFMGAVRTREAARSKDLEAQVEGLLRRIAAIESGAEGDRKAGRDIVEVLRGELASARSEQGDAIGKLASRADGLAAELANGLAAVREAGRIALDDEGSTRLAAQEGLRREILSLEKTAEDMMARIAALASEIGVLSADFASVKHQLEKLEPAVEGHGRAIEQISRARTETVRQLAGLTEQTEALSSEFSAASALTRNALDAAAARLSDLERADENAARRAEELSSLLVGLDGNTRRLDDRVEAIRNALERAQAEGEAEAGALNSDIAEIAAQQAADASDMAAMRGQMLQAQQLLDQRLDRITESLSSEGEAMAGRLAELQTMLDGLRSSQAAAGDKAAQLELVIRKRAEEQFQRDEDQTQEIVRIGEAVRAHDALNAQLREEHVRIEQIAVRLHALIEADVARLDELKARTDNLSAGVAESEGKLSAAIQSARTDIGAASAKHAEAVLGLEKKLADLSGIAASAANAADSAQKAAASGLSSLAANIEGVTQRVTDVTSLAEATSRTSTFNNAVWYQHFSRRLEAAHIDKLQNEWARKLSTPVSRQALGYMAARAVETEKLLEGRLATSIEDIMLRTLVTRAPKGGTLDVLEIGTLFGVGAAILYDNAKGGYESVRFTLLDPLDGYYSSTASDILTGRKVDERTVRRNMNLVGATDDEVRLIKRLSTDPEAVREAAERSYDILIIDADHSYAGVKADFENYARMVKLGGYIVFDDYDSADWPDVKAYVDAEMPAADFVSPVGASWRTAVYRVVKAPPVRRTRSAAPRSPRRKTAG